MTVTYHDDNSIDFAATGGLVAVAFVKGGDNANKYTYSPAVASDTNLVSPLNNGGQVPAVSHTVFCVVDETPPSEEPSPRRARSRCPAERAAQRPAERPRPAPRQRGAMPRRARSPVPRRATTPIATPSEAPGGSVGGETSTPSDGGVEGETDVPEAPQTDPINSSGDAGNTLPILLVVLGIIGLAAVVLTPARARRR